jgi:HEAT repeat protein
MDFDVTIFKGGTPAVVATPGAKDEKQRKGEGRGFAESLRAQLPEEKDDEAKRIIAVALEKIQAREKSESVAGCPFTDVAGFRQAFVEADAAARLVLLSQVTGEWRKRLAGEVADLLKAEDQPVVAASLIKTFARHWPTDRLDALAERLRARSVSLQMTALEALIKIDATQIAEQLPELLESGEPRVRAIAFRGLVQIDVDAAALSLEKFLLSPDPMQKMAGLQNCFHFPFEKIMPILCKFLAGESDGKLIERVGALFATNPHTEVPFHLYEIAELAPPLKAQYIKKILSEACKALEKSGILGDEYRPYIARLQEWIIKRSVSRYVQECILRFAVGKDLDPETEASIAKQLEKPQVRASFEEALGWPIADSAKEQIERLLGCEKPADAPVPPVAPVPLGKTVPEGPVQALPALPGAAVTNGAAVASVSAASVVAPAAADSGQAPSEPAPAPVSAKKPVAPGAAELADSLSPEETIRRIALWTPPQAASVKPILEKLIQNPQSPPDVVATALRTAIRLELKNFTGMAKRILNHADPRPVSAAIEYLGAFDPDDLFPYIGKFLQSSDAFIKISAFNILKKYDLPQAISMLKVLLNNASPEQQNMALTCMIQFDFRLVRDLLFEFLCKNPSDKLFQLGICLFQTNPDPESLPLLFQLEKRVPHTQVDVVRGIRKKNAEFLVKMGVIDEKRLTEIEAGATKPAAGSPRKGSPRPGETRKAGVGAPAGSIDAGERSAAPESRRPESPAAVRAFVGKHFRELAIGGAIMLIFTVLLGLIVTHRAPGDGGMDIAGQTTPVSGSVAEVIERSDELLIKASNGTNYLIPIPPNMVPPVVGEKVKIIVVPFRKEKDGTILARLVSLTKL